MAMPKHVNKGLGDLEDDHERFPELPELHQPIALQRPESHL